MCRRELKDCALSGKQRGDAKEMSHALHTSAKILFFFRRANFFHPAFSTVARRDFAPTWRPLPTSPELTRENGGLSAENGEFFAEISQFFERLAGRRKRTRRRMNRNANIRCNTRHHSRLCRIARASPRTERGAGPHFSYHSTDWRTKTCAGEHTYTGLSLSAFLLHRKNIRPAQAGTRRSVRPTLLKIKHLRLAVKGPIKSPEKW